MRFQQIDFSDRPLRSETIRGGSVWIQWLMWIALAALPGWGVARWVGQERALRAVDTSGAEEAIGAVTAALPGARQTAADEPVGSPDPAHPSPTRAWTELLDRLEQAHTPGVSLRALQPDPVQGRVRLDAEAQDADAMWAYLSRWRALPGVAHVELVAHSWLRPEGTDATGDRLKFQLDIPWKATP